MPEPSRALPSITLSPDGITLDGSMNQPGWPLNHRSAPAGSFAPATGRDGSGAWNGGAGADFGAKTTLWRPPILKATLPPLLTATLRG
jgi:hypothetical protein